MEIDTITLKKDVEWRSPFIEAKLKWHVHFEYNTALSDLISIVIRSRAVKAQQTQL